MNVYAVWVLLTVFLVVLMGFWLPAFQPFCQSDTHLLLPFTNAIHTLTASMFCEHAFFSLIATLAHFAKHSLGYVLPSLPQTGFIIFGHLHGLSPPFALHSPPSQEHLSFAQS